MFEEIVNFNYLQLQNFTEQIGECKKCTSLQQASRLSRLCKQAEMCQPDIQKGPDCNSGKWIYFGDHSQAQ